METLKSLTELTKKPILMLSSGFIWSFSVRNLAFFKCFLTTKWHKRPNKIQKARPSIWLVNVMYVYITNLIYLATPNFNLTIFFAINNTQYFFCFSSINAKGSQMWFQQWFMWLVSSCPNPFQNKVRKTFLLFLLVLVMLTVAMNELLCLKNAGA